MLTYFHFSKYFRKERSRVKTHTPIAWDEKYTHALFLPSDCSDFQKERELRSHALGNRHSLTHLLIHSFTQHVFIKCHEGNLLIGKIYK